MNWLMIKILNSSEKNWNTTPGALPQKILLKTSLTLVFKKVGEFEQFSGAEHRLKGPFLFTGPEVPDLTPQ